MLARTPSRQSNPGCVQHHVQPRASRLQHYNVCFLFRHALTRVQRAGYNASAVQHPPGVPPRGRGAAARGDWGHTATHTAWGCSLCCVRLQPLLPTGCSLGYLRLQARLREELAHARAHGYTLAVKLVRPTLTPTPALTLARTLALTPTPTPNYPRCAARTPRARRSAATRPCSSRPRPRPTRRTILVRRCCSGGSRRRTALQWRRRCVLQRRRARLWRRRR